MSINLSAKYYQENKERLVKDIKILLKKKKKKSGYIAVKAKKISQKRKNESLLSIENILKDENKSHIILIRKYFNLENFAFL